MTYTKGIAPAKLRNACAYMLFMALLAMVGCADAYDASKPVDPAVNVAELGTMIRDRGKVVFRSSDGKGGVADAGMDIVFLPAGQAVFSVQNIAGGRDYTGPYTIDKLGKITFKPTNREDPWTPMWLHRDQKSLYISEQRAPGSIDKMDMLWPLRLVNE